MRNYGCNNINLENKGNCGVGMQTNMQNSCNNTDNGNMMEQMRLSLQELSFTIKDLALYLDTHPDDMRAICIHNEKSRQYRKLSDEYQKVYGPLNTMYPCNSWRWLEQPWPWQQTMPIDGCNRAGNIEDQIEKNDFKPDYDLKGGVK